MMVVVDLLRRACDTYVVSDTVQVFSVDRFDQFDHLKPNQATLTKAFAQVCVRPSSYSVPLSLCLANHV